MLSQMNMQRILAWQKKFGGSNINPAGHALKLLGEAIELCIVAGATDSAIVEVVNASLLKDGDKITGKLDSHELRKECADVAICLALLAMNNGVALDELVSLKLNLLFERDYVADQDGVLRQRGRVKT